MRFTLTYQGPLPPSGNATVKQAIRESLHLQLRELWEHPPLSGHRDLLAMPADGSSINVLRELDGYVFAPLVTRSLRLFLEVDVLLLRAEAPGRIIAGGGDIDNRLKTLFDALRSPVSSQEIKDGARASSVEDPLFVLLEDDELITRVTVETDRWLDAPSAEEVLLTLRCTTRASELIYGNIGMA